MTYSSGRGDEKCTALGVCIESGQSSLEQVEATFHVDVPALVELLAESSDIVKREE